MNLRCIKCKGRLHCGRRVCPIRAKLSAQKNFNRTSKKDFEGQSPNVFVGHFGYPKVNVGLLSTEHYAFHDDVHHWAENSYSIQDIINLRSSLINSNFKSEIKPSKAIDIAQEISLGARPANVEIGLEKKPYFSLTLNQYAAPFGPKMKLLKARITDNTKIPAKVDKAVSDTDLKAADALSYLYENNFKEDYLTKVLSLANLGIKKNRKLVPTRWSITAVDDIIGKKLIASVKDYKVSDCLAFYGSYLGNHYLVLFLPEIWSYELFETYAASDALKDGAFASDFENYSGRKSYASNTAGGYYAARFAVLEKLGQIRRQSSVLCLRFIDDSYYAPLGVWVCRQACKNALSLPPIRFSDKDLMLLYAKKLVSKKFGLDLDIILRKSVMLNSLKSQSKLSQFM